MNECKSAFFVVKSGNSGVNVTDYLVCRADINRAIHLRFSVHAKAYTGNTSAKYGGGLPSRFGEMPKSRRL